VHRLDIETAGRTSKPAERHLALAVHGSAGIQREDHQEAKNQRRRRMDTVDKIARVLGVAFLLQFITSVTSGLLVQPALIVPDNIQETMLNIANNPELMRANILLDMFTALGVIFLGAMLFISLRKQNEPMALIALGFYILEAALLAASRSQAFSLLQISEEYVATGQPAILESMANLALDSMDFVGFTLHMLAFCLGGILFYYLLDKSGIVPRALSLWGLITLVPLLVATLLAILDYQVPQIVAVPYFPFEFVIGIWLVVKGSASSVGISSPSVRTAV
jgi:hypothetical protein